MEGGALTSTLSVQRYVTTESCKVFAQSGTSMATPIVGGTAALVYGWSGSGTSGSAIQPKSSPITLLQVRQYFEQGFYAKHAKMISQSLGHECLKLYTCENISASGALIKAVMINSAQGMALWDQSTPTALADPPTKEQVYVYVLECTNVPV